MRVSRRRGVVTLRLDEVEVQALQGLLDEMDDVLDAMTRDDEVTQRLFPNGHRTDQEAAEQFRELTEEGLRELRRVRYGTVRAALPVPAGAIAIEDPTPWLTTLNDLRLALGTRLGVTEDEPDIDPDSALVPMWQLYFWLTSLQDSLVRAAMR